MSLANSQFILLGADHYNTLEAVRALSYANMTPSIIIKRNDKSPYLVKRSRCSKHYYEVLDYSDGIKLIQQKFSSKDSKTFIISCDDEWAELLDKSSKEFGSNIYVMGGVIF